MMSLRVPDSLPLDVGCLPHATLLCGPGFAPRDANEVLARATDAGNPPRWQWFFGAKWPNPAKTWENKHEKPRFDMAETTRIPLGIQFQEILGR